MNKFIWNYINFILKSWPSHQSKNPTISTGREDLANFSGNFYTLLNNDNNLLFNIIFSKIFHSFLNII